MTRKPPDGRICVKCRGAGELKASDGRFKNCEACDGMGVTRKQPFYQPEPEDKAPLNGFPEGVHGIDDWRK